MTDFSKCPVCKEILESTQKEVGTNKFLLTCSLCGVFETTEEFILIKNNQLLKEKGFILSGVLRNAYRIGKRELVTTSNYQSLIESPKSSKKSN